MGKEEKKIISREVINGLVLITYKGGLVKAIDKDRYYDSLDIKEKNKFIVDSL